MATVYSIKIKTVSAFVNYNEAEMEKIIVKLLKEYKDEKTGLGLESTNVDVERLA